MAFDKSRSAQVSKIVNSKGGSVKVLVLNAAFNGTDRSKGPLERSSLHRLVIEAHETETNGKEKTTLSLSGNIPSEKLPALLALSEQALFDKVVYQQERSFPLLPGVWKPRMSTQDENGNVEVYSAEINYIGNYKLPIQFKLTTLRAPVGTDETGKINVKLRETVEGSKKEITFYISAEDWYNQLSNANDMYNLYRERAMQNGVYDPAFGLTSAEE